MKSSELRRWLEQQEALHGDLDIACMTAFGNVAEGDQLTVAQLGVTTQGKLALHQDGIDEDAKVITIGFGGDF